MLCLSVAQIFRSIEIVNKIVVHGRGGTFVVWLEPSSAHEQKAPLLHG